MSVLSQHHFYPKWLPLSSFHHYVEPVTLALLTHALPVKQQESFVALRLTFTQLLPPPLDRTQHCIGFVSASLCECQGVNSDGGKASFCAQGRLMWTPLKTWPKKSTSHHWNLNLSFSRHLYPMQKVPQEQLRAKCLAQGQNGTTAGLWPQ